MTPMEFRKKFTKICKNGAPSFEYDTNGEKVVKTYDNTDMQKFARQAFDNGRDYFCIKMIETEDGTFIQQTDPEYVYIAEDFTESEYNSLFNSVKAQGFTRWISGLSAINIQHCEQCAKAYEWTTETGSNDAKDFNFCPNCGRRF